MNKFYALAITCLLTSTLSFAHDGHDHGTGQVQATKGGVIQKAGKLFVEIVGTKKEIKVYPLQATGSDSKVLKSVPLNEVKLTASYKLPKQTSAKEIILTQNKDHFTGNVDAGKFHRYEVIIKVEAGSMKDEISYQIEPQE